MITTLAILLALGTGTGAVQPYAGEHERPIKALSIEEIQGLTSGAGMGMAKAAELNHLPGPKHVLDHAEALGLDFDQLLATQKSFEAMAQLAKNLGAEIVEAEARLDGLFAAEKHDPAILEAVVAEIADLRGQLRWAHLQAHLEVAALLEPEQVATYDRLRGYGEAETTEEDCPHEGQH